MIHYEWTLAQDTNPNTAPTVTKGTGTAETMEEAQEIAMKNAPSLSNEIPWEKLSFSTWKRADSECSLFLLMIQLRTLEPKDI